MRAPSDNRHRPLQHTKIEYLFFFFVYILNPLDGAPVSCSILPNMKFFRKRFEGSFLIPNGEKEKKQKIKIGFPSFDDLLPSLPARR